MKILEKFSILAGEMFVEAAEELRRSPACSPGVTRTADAGSNSIPLSPSGKLQELPVYRAALPNGARFSMLKTMLTSVCERNCNYCSFRSGRDFHRVSFKPDELADAFIKMYQAGIVEGLFLSSGIAGGSTFTQDRLIATAEILRYKHGFTGYLHLKIMPGADFDQILRSMQLADRVSVNLEAPTPDRLACLAPQKRLQEDLLQPLRWVDHIRREIPASRGWMGRWPSSCTQFVVGAAGETDRELLTTSQYLMNTARLLRAYFSTFNPIPGTPLEGRPRADPWRAHRLYQAFFLLRDYGFTAQELPYDPAGTLPRTLDPKSAWAQAQLMEAPIELNHAEMIQLLRIPGIGPVAARAILAARKQRPLRRLEDLRALGIRAERAAPYILLSGQRPVLQPKLF